MTYSEMYPVWDLHSCYYYCRYNPSSGGPCCTFGADISHFSAYLHQSVAFYTPSEMEKYEDRDPLAMRQCRGKVKTISKDLIDLEPTRVSKTHAPDGDPGDGSRVVMTPLEGQNERKEAKKRQCQLNASFMEQNQSSGATYWSLDLVRNYAVWPVKVRQILVLV